MSEYKDGWGDYYLAAGKREEKAACAHSGLGEKERLAELISAVIDAANEGLGRDGCPFCAGVSAHEPTCIAKRVSEGRR